MSDPVHVVFWPYYHRLEGRMGWFEEAFPRSTCRWFHRFEEFHMEYDGAIVVLNGAADPPLDLHRLNDQLNLLRWVMLVVIGDEGTKFPLQYIDHPRLSLWGYDPKPGSKIQFHALPAGPIQQVVDLAAQVQVLRNIDWFVSGSIRDLVWDSRIRRLPGDGRYYPHHLGYPEYVENLKAARIVPCRPSWTSPETCRVYDALEAGSIPIVGMYPGENPPGHQWWRPYGYDWPNFWENVLGEKPPFPIISGPEHLSAAVEMALFDENLDQRCFEWWSDYKKRLKETLQTQVRRLQG